MPIDIERVRSRITELGSVGREPRGGVTRLSYSSAYRQGIELVRSWMAEAGLRTRLDGVGNLIGRLDGAGGVGEMPAGEARNGARRDADQVEPSLPVVMTGSHMDTVPCGGVLDGALGIVAAIECVQAWREEGWRPCLPVEVVAFVEEEGTRFGIGCMGSRAMMGDPAVADAEALRDATGRTLAAHLREWGLDPGSTGDARRDPKGIRCFLELHIEQGEELELTGSPVALVTRIVGIDRYRVRVRGRASHAGATRMDRRSDALVAAARVIDWVYERALAQQDVCVATVGRVNVSPGATNVVPGEADFVVEVRSPEARVLEDFRADLQARLQEVAGGCRVRCQVEWEHRTAPVSLDGRVLKVLREVAEELAVGYCEMPSWAGHDAKVFAPLVPTGMIFVPCRGGISHAPEEDTYWDRAALGVELLCRTLRRLAS